MPLELTERLLECDDENGDCGIPATPRCFPAQPASLLVPWRPRLQSRDVGAQ